MAQGVDKTYSKEYFKALIQFFQVSKAMPYDQVKAMVDNVKENLAAMWTWTRPQAYGQKVAGYLPRHQRENGFEEITQEEALQAAQYAAQTAWRETDKATYQAMEALVHNLNTMNSRAGAQVPFSSLNYGTDTSEQGRMVIRNLLLATEAGLGDGETPIFPGADLQGEGGRQLQPRRPELRFVPAVDAGEREAPVPELCVPGQPLQPAVL